jgi:hypothetical protein
MSEIFVCSGKVFDFMSLLYRWKTVFKDFKELPKRLSCNRAFKCVVLCNSRHNELQ